MIFKLVLVVLTALYPVIVYFGLSHFSPWVFGLLLLGLFLLRFSDAGENRRVMLIPLLLMVIYSLSVSLFNSETLLRLYPVAVSLMMLCAFAYTLLRPPTMIARLAGLRGLEVPEDGHTYVRNLTWIWCAFFLMNMLIALYTGFQSREMWVLYNGLISYLLIGALLGGEVLFRIWFKRRVTLSG